MRAFFTHPAFAVAMFALLALGPMALWDKHRDEHRPGYGQGHDVPEAAHELTTGVQGGSGAGNGNGEGGQQEQRRWYDPSAPITTVLHGLMLFVTAIGVGAVVSTLNATRAAVREAEKATAAAVETARIARSDQRPWVDFEIGSNGMFYIEKHPSGVGYIFKINISARNVGRSPANHVVFLADVKQTAFGETPIDFYRLANTFRLESRTNYQAGRVSESAMTLFPGGEPYTFTKFAYLAPEEINHDAFFGLSLMICACYRWGDKVFMTDKARVIGHVRDDDRKVFSRIDAQALDMRKIWSFVNAPTSQYAN